MKLLAIGDLHLGRLPSRLPEDLNHESRALGPSGAWRRVIDEAITQQVNIVVLAGDVADSDKDFFEAYRELHRGVSRLTNEGIKVLGVAGNHDVSLLPRLAAEIVEFQLVGRNGQWERVDLDNGNEQVTLWGWSFPQREVRQSPLTDAQLKFVEGRVNLGLLHCDRDQANSPYGPVSSADLTRAGLNCWLLGHVHKPDVLTTESPSGYLGSVSGTDPGEPGAHGPWLITIEKNSIHAIEQWVLAPLRWEVLKVDITGITATDDISNRLLEKVRDIDAELHLLTQPPLAVGLRVSLIGQSNLGQAAYRRLMGEQLVVIHDGDTEIQYFIECVKLKTRPEINLEELANEPSPAGLLARRLLWLDDGAGTEEYTNLITEAQAPIQEEHSSSKWGVLGLPTPDANAVADLLRNAGMRLLDRMLEQRRDEVQ